MTSFSLSDAGGASAGRTDEEIQIVFDRYKAALYRMYNRELRKDPTLRGQIIIKLTIEPDGSVSFCALQSSDMNAPVLAEQVVERVSTFDFGAKEDIAAERRKQIEELRAQLKRYSEALENDLQSGRERIANRVREKPKWFPPNLFSASPISAWPTPPVWRSPAGRSKPTRMRLLNTPTGAI